MNQRNISALVSLLLDLAPLTGVKAQIQQDAERMARYLAGRGVLVPAALTDEEAHQVGTGWANGPQHTQLVGPVVKLELERLAKGEK